MQSTEVKADPIHVKTFEELVQLVKEWEEDYLKNWCMSAEEAYVKWLDFINNLWKNDL